MANCPNCGTPARPQARFCSKCGTPLVTGAGITPPPPPLPSPEKQSMLQSAVPVQSGPLKLSSPPLEELLPAPEIQAQEEAPPAGADTGMAVAEAEAAVPAQQTVSTVDAASDEERVEERKPLVVGRAGVIEQRIAIAEKLLACVPFAQPDYREKNKSMLERPVRLSLPISDTSWGQVAFIAGVYGSLMGGNILDAQQKLGLWQALLWAIQYEYYFRLLRFVERFLHLAGFLHTCNADKAFQAAAFSNLETVLLQFDKPYLKNVREAVEKQPASQAITSLKQLLDRSLEKDDFHAVLSALERLWYRLDRSKEKQNRETLEEARRSGLTPQVTARLVVMSVFVCKNFLEHASPAVAKGLFDEELQAALTLSAFACRFATGSYISEAQKCDVALKAMQEGRTQRSQGTEQVPANSSPSSPVRPEQPPVIASPGRVEQNGKAETAGSGRQNGVAPMKSVQGTNFAQRATAEQGTKVAASSWQEDPRRRLEAIFGAETPGGLLESMRNFRLDLMRTTLRRNRPRLLSTLSAMLAALPFFDELLPPRSAFYLRGNVQGESFPDLKKRLLGSDDEVKRRTLAQLEQMEGDALERDAALAREWTLFGRAVVLGLDKALPAWREHYNKSIASPEEIWNLAVIAVRSGDKAQALEILRRGVKEQTASVAHLCLALKCGLDILLQAEHYPRAATGMVMPFLLDALLLLPLPESYLIWLLLASEVQDAPDSTRQSDVIGLFLGLLERPLQLLLADRRATEMSIDEFESECRELLSTIKQLEQRYSLELHDGKIMIQSKMLRSSLRTVQAKRSRVGLFVDYENLRPWLPLELQGRPEEVGAILTRHVGRYGEVVCRWLCAAPRNVPGSDVVARKFEGAGFKVQFPRGRTGQLNPKGNLTDFVLLECIILEQTRSQPDVYVIVSGDADYFERVSRLIEGGNAVHIVACHGNLSTRYVRLADRYAQGLFPEGHGGIFIDYLEEILAARAR